MKRPLRVMQLLPELESGGVERGTLELSAALVAAGHESIVVSHGGRLVTELEGAGGRHITLPIHRKALSSLWQVRPLRRLIQTLQPDVVHVRSRVPAWLTWLALRKLPLAQRPLHVSTVHGFYSVNAYSAIMTRADAVIAVSDSVVSYILDNYDCPSDRITRIYRGISPAAYPHGWQPDAGWYNEIAQAYPELVGKTWYTLPGRITRLKGHELFLQLIAAQRKHDPRVHGVIVGGAHAKKQAYLAELKALTQQLGLTDHVTFTGQRGDMRSWLAASHRVFSLSTQPETFGRTVLEALALGTPVLGLDQGGVGEVMQMAYPSGLVPVVADAQKQLECLVTRLNEPLPPVAPVQGLTLQAMTDQTIALYQAKLQARLNK